MKIAEQNTPEIIDALFDVGETPSHKSDRIQYIVDIDYDFDGNDATDVTNAHTVSRMAFLGRFHDPVECWESMRDYVATAGGVENIPADEQPIAIAHLSVTPDLARQLRTARRSRVDEASALLYNELTGIQVDEIFDEVEGDELIEAYVGRSRRGTEHGDKVGVTDYIQAKEGTKYAVGEASKGLRAKGWTPANHTIEQLADRIERILVKGRS